MLIGVILATMAPAALASLGTARDGYPAFGVLMAAACIIVAAMTVPMWRRPVKDSAPISLGALRQAGAMQLLGIALANSLPVAITATLFVFFVEDRLQLPGYAGPLLLLFFISAGASVPVWTRVAQRLSGRRTLLIAMPLAIVGFSWAAVLSQGDLWPFVIVCIVSGIATGADLVVLPAMFSIALTEQGLNASAAFGFWSFAGKLGLALAAFLVLPFIDQAGFVPGGENDAAALTRLTLSYAILPCVLKVIAFAMVWTLPEKETHQ